MKEKVCTSCKVEKSIFSFYTTKRGILSICKDCSSLKNKITYKRNRERIKLRDKARLRTKEGLVGRMYLTQKSNSSKRGYGHPSYTKEQFIDWCMSQPIFHELYDAWVASGYEKDLVPSVDRKDDYVGYEISNIQIMSWRENRMKGSRDRVSGQNNKVNKAVIATCINTGEKTEYHSVMAASRCLNINQSNINRCCNNRKYRKTAKGYTFKYK